MKSKLTCKTENEEYRIRRFKVEQIFVLKDYKLSNPKLLKEWKSEIWIYKVPLKKMEKNY